MVKLIPNLNEAKNTKVHGINYVYEELEFDPLKKDYYCTDNCAIYWKVFLYFFFLYLLKFCQSNVIRIKISKFEGVFPQTRIGHVVLDISCHADHKCYHVVKDVKRRQYDKQVKPL